MEGMVARFVTTRFSKNFLFLIFVCICLRKISVIDCFPSPLIHVTITVSVLEPACREHSDGQPHFLENIEFLGI